MKLWLTFLVCESSDIPNMTLEIPDYDTIMKQY